MQLHTEYRTPPRPTTRYQPPSHRRCHATPTCLWTTTKRLHLISLRFEVSASSTPLFSPSYHLYLSAHANNKGDVVDHRTERYSLDVRLEEHHFLKLVETGARALLHKKKQIQLARYYEVDEIETCNLRLAQNEGVML
jgi:hypothetical protein